jgi:hypothetical protein
MHWTTWALAGLALAIPVVAAQPGAVDLLQDTTGDVRIAYDQTGVGNPTPRFAALDLVAAHAQESADSIAFTLKVAGLDASTEPPLLESVFYELGFLQGDVQYAVQLGRIHSQSTGYFGQLARYNPATQAYYAIEYLDVEADVSAATMTTSVPRALLVDSNGGRPSAGSRLTGFFAESRSFMELFNPGSATGGQESLTIRDRMPDTGVGSTDFTLQLGPVQAGSARLTSPLPSRQSNGAATTFLFTAQARNVGESDEVYALEVQGAPREWRVTLPEDAIQVPAGGNVSLPILVEVPFAHQHGTWQSFILRMQSTKDAVSRAELELGVLYPKVPQPAGHHATLFVHGAKFTDDPLVPIYAAVFNFNVEYAWMNALEEDPSDQRVPVPADSAGTFVPSVPDTFHWTIPLSPDLAIGLDFDLDGEGVLLAEIDSPVPTQGAALSGELVLYVDSRFDEFGQRSGGNRTVLATLDASPAQDLGAGEKRLYTLPVKPTPASDLVHFKPRSALVLELTLTGMRPDTIEARVPPRLHPGATLTLPLFEYHDPVDASFATKRMSLKAESQDRLANAGKTLVYKVALTSSADAPEYNVALSVAGKSAQHAQLLAPANLVLKPGESRNVTVALRVPATARVGDTLDLVLQAQAAEDRSVRSVVRLFATVSPRDVPDEADLAASLDTRVTQETPGFAVPLVVAGLAAAWAARRKPL